MEETMQKVMKKMMEGLDGNPMQMCMSMCKDMTASVQEAADMAALATPELRTLFGEWLKLKEQALLDSVEKSGAVDPEKMAKALKLSRESTVYLLARLAGSGKLKLSVERTATRKKNTDARKGSAEKKRKDVGSGK